MTEALPATFVHLIQADQTITACRLDINQHRKMMRSDDTRAVDCPNCKKSEMYLKKESDLNYMMDRNAKR